jgi:hypothetical protein
MSNERRFIRAACGTLIAETLTQPLCTIKTLYQTTPSATGWLPCARTLYRESGVWGFIRSSPLATCSQIIASSTKITCYLGLVDAVGDQVPKPALGAVAGALGGLFSHPLDVLRIQVQRGDGLKFSAARAYRGLRYTLQKNVLVASILFPTFSALKSRDHGTITSAVGASLLTTLIVHPVDLWKTQRVAGVALGGLYRGFTLNLARVLPHFVLTMVVMEKI